MRQNSLEFLKSIVAAPSPSGFEQPVARLHRDYVGLFANRVSTDTLGNVTAIIHPEAATRIMYAGHMDEIGFIVRYIDEDGFLFFTTIGGTGPATEVGQRVRVHGRDSVVGVVGRKAIQTFKPADTSQSPSLKDQWIYIGASSREVAEAAVPVGSPETLETSFARLLGNHVVGRAFDNKAGLFIAAEVLRKLSEDGGIHPDVGVYILGTAHRKRLGRAVPKPRLLISPREPGSSWTWELLRTTPVHAMRTQANSTWGRSGAVAGAQHESNCLENAERRCHGVGDRLPTGRRR